MTNSLDFTTTIESVPAAPSGMVLSFRSAPRPCNICSGWETATLGLQLCEHCNLSPPACDAEIYIFPGPQWALSYSCLRNANAGRLCCIALYAVWQVHVIISNLAIPISVNLLSK
ncbi:MAG: hypothetical protein ACR5K9_04760 [Wolbachia sp.]